MKIKEIIVVEGRDDSAKIRQAIDADTIETNGSAINDKTLQQIKHAKEKRGVIIFTDPDYPGKRIRHIIDQSISGCKHAFLAKDKARANSDNKSLGIEHASIMDIRQALENVYELTERKESNITQEDLINYGLIGTPDARSRRTILGERLHIGQTNGKQLLRRLTMFQINKEQLEHAINRMLQEESNDV